MNIVNSVMTETPYFANTIPNLRATASWSGVGAGRPLDFADCATPRANSASNTGSSTLNVRATIRPITIATNNIGGQTLLCCQRRNTPAGATKMSIKSSQNDGWAGCVATDAVVDSLISRRG